MPVTIDVVVYEVTKKAVLVEVKDAAYIEEAGPLEWVPKAAIAETCGTSLEEGHAGQLALHDWWAEANGFNN